MAYYGKHLEGRRHPVVRAVAISTVMVLLALGCSGYLVYRHLEGNVTISDALSQITEPRPSRVAVEGPKEPLNVLVLGNDSRAGQKAVAGNTPGLSDTTILLHLSADRRRAYGVSIPRDLMVERPPCTDKHTGKEVPAQDSVQWNDAFAVGGEACTIQQFEHMTQLRVDHFLVVDFAGFKNMVDALGGVPVCLPKAVNDPIGRIYLPAGSYTVKGAQALDYVRVRHSIGTTDTGDIGRMKRQQTFLAAMANKALEAGTLFNPKRLYDFLNAATQSLTTDRGLHKLTEMASLANQVKGIGLNRVQFLSMPFEPYAPDPNRLQAAPDAQELWRLLRRDERLPRKFTGDAAKASDKPPKPGQTPSPSSDPTKAAEAARAGLCA